MKKKYIAIAASALLLFSCGGNNDKDNKAPEETPAEIEAAHLAGRAAARRVVNRVFRDSMELHGTILEANAERSNYELENKHKCAAAYDSAFISTIRVTRPDLADKLSK